MRSGVDFDDLDFHRRHYDPQIAYAQSKTANSLFSVEATRRWARDGIVANTVNPGGVATHRHRPARGRSDPPSTRPNGSRRRRPGPLLLTTRRRPRRLTTTP